VDKDSETHAKVKDGSAVWQNDLAHLPGGFAAGPSTQAYLHNRRTLDFGAAQPGQVQPMLSILCLGISTRSSILWHRFGHAVENRVRFDDLARINRVRSIAKLTENTFGRLV
jgi:hypothetical protein